MAVWERNAVDAKAIAPPMSANAAATLRDLFELLEDYAPAWYTEEHRNRAAAALGELVLRAAAS